MTNRLLLDTVQLGTNIDAWVANAIATDSLPVVPTRVEISSEVGYTISDLLDYEVNDDGRGRVVISVPDASEAQTELTAVSADSNAGIRRIVTAFSDALTEAVTAQASQAQDTVRAQFTNLQNGSRSFERLLGRQSLTDLIDCNNRLIDFLRTPQARAVVAGGYREYTSYVTEFPAFGSGDDYNLRVVTKSRFKVADDGTVQHRFGHGIETNGSGQFRPLRALAEAWASNTGEKVMVKRYNKNVSGALNHVLRFAYRALDEINIEIDRRIEDFTALNVDVPITRVETDIPAMPANLIAAEAPATVADGTEASTESVAPGTGDTTSPADEALQMPADGATA